MCLMVSTEALAQARSSSRASAAEYERARTTLEARQKREEEAADRRCQARVAPSREARIRAAATTGDAGVVRGAFNANCASARDMLRAKHLAEWMDLEEAYRQGRPLPDYQGDGASETSAEDARIEERRRLEEELSEERHLLSLYLKSRDDHGTNRSLEEDIATAHERVAQADQNYIDHLRRHSPAEADAYLEDRWNIQNTQFIRNENLREEIVRGLRENARRP